MKPLTKKYIFEQKLKGEPIDLTAYAGPEADGDVWDELIALLLETGILSNRMTSISMRAREEDDKNWVQYPVRIKDQTGEESEWHPKFS